MTNYKNNPADDDITGTMGEDTFEGQVDESPIADKGELGGRAGDLKEDADTRTPAPAVDDDLTSTDD